MIDQEHKGIMQKNRGASMGCLQNKAFPSNLQDSRNPFKGFPEVKDEINGPPGGGHGSSLTHDSFAPPCEGYYRPMYPQEICMFSTFHPDFQRVQQNQWNAFGSQIYSMNHNYPPPIENQFQYVPFGMCSQLYPHEFQNQYFEYFVVIDFEATCDKEKNPHPQEIIEFPSVLVNSFTGQLEASFQTYVRPVVHQQLSDFCKELTGIQQNQVDRGVPLSEALQMHDKWLQDKGIIGTKFAVVTWSNWDCRVMLDSECRSKKITKPEYFDRWINLKVPFHETFGAVRCNLKEAVQLAGLAWEGRAHCGLDDARNTARLLSYLMHRGIRFNITNWMSQYADQSLSWQQSPDCSLGPNHHLYKPKHPPVALAKSFSAPAGSGKDHHKYCLCGVKSCKGMIKRPGPKQGSVFFGCGNWTAARGGECSYFEWASP